MRRAIRAAISTFACVLGCGGEPAPVGAPDATPTVLRDADAPVWPAWGPALAPAADPALERALIRAELRRDPSDEAIERALASSDPATRIRGAWASTRIGGAPAVERAAAWLADGGSHPAGMLAAIAALVPPPPASDERAPTPSDRERSFAEIEARLWQRYSVTDDPERAIALLLAIARVGGAASQAWLAADLGEIDGDDPRAVRAMDAMAILCRRGYALTPQGVTAIGGGLASTSAPLRHASALTLERCAGPSAEDLAGPVRAPLVERLATFVTETSDDDAHAGWIALAALGELPKAIPVDVLGVAPRGWTSEVAAVRALAANADGRRELVTRLARLDLAKVDGARWHVPLEALRKIRSAIDGAPELADALAPLHARVDAALRDANGRRRKGLVLLRCELLTVAAIRTGKLDALQACADGRDGVPASHGAKLAVEALLQVGSALPREQRVDGLLARATDSRPDVATTALSALAEVDDPRVAKALRDALAGDDVGLVSAAAGSIASRGIDRQRRDVEAAPALADAIARLRNDTAVEARVAAIEALGNLAGSGAPTVGEAPGASTGIEHAWLERNVLPLASDPNQAVRDAARHALRHAPDLVARFDAAEPTAFPRAFAPAVHAAVDAHAGASHLILHTDAGEIEIDLRGAVTPIAHANLVALASAGFFAGLTFHRVVPDFVIQGGDPRGDGYGGPGHVMPCEWSNLKYERGVVGIALAGKDTGGSQIFIAHGRPVHLDARFTAIGRVTTGLGVVDAILPYDGIQRVEVRP